MTSWKDKLHKNPIPWLLEPDTTQPAIRYFTLRDILGRSNDDNEVKESLAANMLTGPVPAILAAQERDGYWDKPGPGYGPKYRGTQWAIVFMAQLGADGTHPRVRTGCEYVLNHTIADNGSLSMNGAPSGFTHCMAGNLGAALIDLGWLADQRLRAALGWQAQTITGEGVADPTRRDTNKRYYKSGTSAPLFACSVNAGLPCAWGAVKAMLAFSKVPPSLRTQRVKVAIQRGIAFLLSHDPAVADYPFGMGNRPNSSWFKFGYPIGYITDVLQNLEVLVTLGQAQDPRLDNAMKLLISKQDNQGRWPLEYTYNGKSWVDIEKKGQPSKWVTLRALRVLKATYP
ncbi:nitrogen fixation protein NifH [Chloroflexota bacterium]